MNAYQKTGLWIALVLALAGLLIPTGQAQSADAIRDLIPRGVVQVDIMEVGAWPRQIELAARLQASVAAHPEWWVEYVAKAPPGQPLPYHPRLGLTEAEYQEFLELSSSMQMVKVADGTLNFVWDSPTHIRLIGEGSLADLTGITIDLAADRVETPFAILRERTEINNTDVDSPTGPWRGIQWKFEHLTPDLSSGAVVKLALGRRDEDGRGILYYNARRIKGRSAQSVRYVLYYDLPE